MTARIVTRKSVLILVLLALCLPGLARMGDKNNEFRSGKILSVVSKEKSSSADRTDVRPSEPGAYSGVGNGSYSMQPTYFVNYLVLLDVGEEIFSLSGSFDTSHEKPHIKSGEVQYRWHGSKRVQILDSQMRKFDFDLIKREPKPPAAQPAPAASAQK
jgi:hypothetical protein